MSTNNQIIQAIAVDIACGGDFATRITRILTVDSKALMSTPLLQLLFMMLKQPTLMVAMQMKVLLIA
jgi:hypothetical protein